MGLDVSNRWHFNKGSFMIGYNFQRDLETKTTSPIYVGGYRTKEGAHHHYQRNMHSIFGQLAYHITEKDEADFNFRETWTEDDSAGNGYDKFTPEVAWTHSFNEETSLYAKAGKSFMMPTFTQLYGGGNIVGVPDLKPETGNHYEVGFKKNIGNSTWRFDVFHYKIKNHIDADSSKWPTVTYENTDIRNTGVELEWSRRQNDRLSYHMGITYGHPEKDSPLRTIMNGMITMAALSLTAASTIQAAN